MHQYLMMKLDMKLMKLDMKLFDSCDLNSSDQNEKNEKNEEKEKSKISHTAVDTLLKNWNAVNSASDTIHLWRKEQLNTQDCWHPLK